jgi:hypothetical protein
MSDRTGITEILVSQLGAPEGDAAVWLGIGLVVLVVLGWIALEFGLARLIGRIVRALNPPPSDP